MAFNSLPTIETVTAIVEKHRDRLGLEQIEQVNTALIGRGEANLNVLVRVNQSQCFNLRIGLRNQESERNLQNEFEVLKIAPKEVGPSAFAIDFQQTNLPQPYILIEYIDGRLKQQWNLSDLQAHARTLAHLHQRKFCGHGAVHHLSNAPYDFVHRFDVAVNYWRIHHPYLFDIPIVKRLLPSIHKFVTLHNNLFMGLRHFTIIHGDAHPLNILFSNNRIRYIDWERAAIGDPASDIAMIGWDIATSWQMELTSEWFNSFLDTYLALEPDVTLCQRRDVWMVYTMFFDQMYHRTQMTPDLTDKHSYTVQQIETYLTTRFL